MSPISRSHKTNRNFLKSTTSWTTNNHHHAILNFIFLNEQNEKNEASSLFYSIFSFCSRRLLSLMQVSRHVQTRHLVWTTRLPKSQKTDVSVATANIRFVGDKFCRRKTQSVQRMVQLGMCFVRNIQKRSSSNQNLIFSFSCCISF